MQTSTATRVPSHTAGHPHNCRCLSCCNHAAAWHRNRRRQTAYGRWQPFVPVTAALTHVAALNRAGMTDRQIAKAAGLTDCDLWEMRRSRDKIRPETEARILAVRLDLRALDPKAFLPSRGAERRLQALRAIGWPGPQLAARSGLSADTLSRIYRSPYVWASTMIRVHELYDDLRHQNPTEHGVLAWVAERSRREARKKGWAVPAAWTDIDAAAGPNPKVSRMDYRPVPLVRSRAEVVTETAHLAAGGATREQVAARLGIDWDSIAVAHARAAEPLPLALR